jgi:hypothetical protein
MDRFTLIENLNLNRPLSSLVEVYALSKRLVCSFFRTDSLVYVHTLFVVNYYTNNL